MNEVSDFILDTLLEEGRVAQADLLEVRNYSAEQGVSLTDALLALKVVTPKELAIARAKICEYPFVDLDDYEVEFRNALHLPKSTSEKQGIFPLFVLGDTATVAMEDPLNLQAIDDVNRAMKMTIEPVIAEPGQLRSLIERSYSLARTANLVGQEAGDSEELTTGDEPIVAAVNQIVMAAAEAGASDVHISPDESILHVRYRIDGVLQPQQAPDLSVHQGLIQRLKVMALLDLTQTRRPQDGKFRFRHTDPPIDVRLSVIPTVHGENAVLRLLRPASTIGTIRDLGMPSSMTDRFEGLIAKPHGMLLVTGPTGSGKTTTLYTALSHINSPHRNIMTIEDPVEIRLPMIRQIQANHEIGLDFASALRSILRQDPDVVLVGEIRDEETARIAVQAAMTGHLVFSTLHTNDAPGSIARLRDLGLPPFAIANSVLGVLSQRLIRKLCQTCIDEDPSGADLAASMGLTPSDGARFKRGRGCPSCLSTGFAGRIGAYEFLTVGSELRTLIEQDADVGLFREGAILDGMRPIIEDGLRLAELGVTGVSELAKLHSTIDSHARASQASPAGPRPQADERVERAA